MKRHSRRVSGLSDSEPESEMDALRHRLMIVEAENRVSKSLLYNACVLVFVYPIVRIITACSNLHRGSWGCIATPFNSQCVSITS